MKNGLVRPGDLDPGKNVAALIGDECFLCGKPILGIHASGWFGKAGFDLPLHIACAEGKSPAQVAAEYQRRACDLVNIRRLA